MALPINARLPKVRSPAQPCNLGLVLKNSGATLLRRRQQSRQGQGRLEIKTGQISLPAQGLTNL
jgi:hypothetical protein